MEKPGLREGRDLPLLGGRAGPEARVLTPGPGLSASPLVEPGLGNKALVFPEDSAPVCADRRDSYGGCRGEGKFRLLSFVSSLLGLGGA